MPAHLESVHVGAHLGHNPHNLVPRDHGKGGVAPLALDLVQVGVADTGVGDLHANIVGANCRRGQGAGGKGWQVVEMSVRPRWGGAATNARCVSGDQAQAARQAGRQAAQAAQASAALLTRAAVEAEGGQHTRGVLSCKGQAVAAALALQQSRE